MCVAQEQTSIGSCISSTTLKHTVQAMTWNKLLSSFRFISMFLYVQASSLKMLITQTFCYEGG